MTTTSPRQMSLPLSRAFDAKPIRTSTPSDFGGIDARRGFAYQDDVAVMFCLEMLHGEDILEVWCETHDDIVVIRKGISGEQIEFVQVKDIRFNQLWTPAKLCQRVAQKAGSSILESSLARDRHEEPAIFRIVTSREVGDELRPLLLPRDHEDRAPGTEKMNSLETEISSKLPGIISEKGTTHTQWLKNTLWSTPTREEIINKNRVALYQFVESTGKNVFSDTVNSLYDKIRGRVKAAAEEPWSSRAKKMLQRKSLADWILTELDPMPAIKHEERLTQKLTAADVDSTHIADAIDFRREYIREIRQPRFYDVGTRDYYKSEVPAILHRLRTELDSGTRNESGPAFHGTCVHEVSRLQDSSPDGLKKPGHGFLLGCMYETTARCRHRFTKVGA